MSCINHKQSVLLFSQIEKNAIDLADFIQSHKKSLEDVLLTYESSEVVEDEINRTIDLLENILENRTYFTQSICSTFVFLPRNQPLYALFCFAVIPSFMSDKVFIKRPSSYGKIFDTLIKIFKTSSSLDNIYVFTGSRNSFLNMVNAKTHTHFCGGRSVIFTGTGKNAHDISQQINKKILFIANGSSHNPIVVSHDASVTDAVDAVLKVKVYNSGQDCAAPNSILVHSDVYTDFMKQLKNALKKISVGSYLNIQNRIGPLSDKKSIYFAQNIIAGNKQWIDQDFSGSFLSSNTMKPLLISRPLALGGGYSESYAPIFFVQEYPRDQDLKIYFEHTLYIENAGYISVFGSSDYINKLTFKKIGKNKVSRLLHPKETILNNTNLHAPGIERGIKPYGGYGKSSSFVSYQGKKTYMPTLVQRDIFNFLIKPSI